MDCPRWIGGLTEHTLRLDGNGNPHLAYGGDHLYYATYDGTAWHYETVDKSPMVGASASLALDQASQPHISYYDGLNQDLKFAFRDIAGWHVETVDTGGDGGDVGGVTALAVDPGGHAHVIYLDATNRTLKYAYRDEAGWQIEQFGNASQFGTISLAVSSIGLPHLSYFDTVEAALIYAFRDASGWHTETVVELVWELLLSRPRWQRPSIHRLRCHLLSTIRTRSQDGYLLAN